jgi:hypothetical protein
LELGEDGFSFVDEFEGSVQRRGEGVEGGVTRAVG